MWPFSKKVNKQELLGYKSMKIHGWKFVIKKVNPLMDFPDGRIPQLFTAFITKRKPADPKDMPEVAIKRIEEDMKIMVEAGLVEPALVARGKPNEGITVDDLFREPEVATKLYWEIFIHSLNRFKGIRGLFFSIRIRYMLWMLLRKDMGEDQARFVLKTAN